jgi:hypothetical protein
MRKFFYVVWLVIWETIRYPFSTSVFEQDEDYHWNIKRFGPWQ